MSTDTTVTTTAKELLTAAANRNWQLTRHQSAMHALELGDAEDVDALRNGLEEVWEALDADPVLSPIERLWSAADACLTADAKAGLVNLLGDNHDALTAELIARATYGEVRIEPEQAAFSMSETFLQLLVPAQESYQPDSITEALETLLFVRIDTESIIEFAFRCARELERATRILTSHSR